MSVDSRMLKQVLYVLETGVSFIQKPFAPDALAKKVREVLEA